MLSVGSLGRETIVFLGVERDPSEVSCFSQIFFVIIL